MHFTRFWSIVEATHTIQNPTSPQKLDRLIDTLQLNANHTVLDIGCGKGSAAAMLPSTKAPARQVRQRTYEGEWLNGKKLSER